MLNLPQKTLFKKRIPKQSFYEETKADTKTKQFFVDHIESIEWRNKISPETTNLDVDGTIREIQIFTIRQRTDELPQKLLEMIDTKIPYPILFLLINQQTELIKLKMANKKINANKNTALIHSYNETIWLPEEKIKEFKIIQGNTVTEVYNNILKLLVEVKTTENETIEETLEKDLERQKLEKEIEKLRKRMKREKQTNRKVDLNIQLQKKVRQLEALM